MPLNVVLLMCLRNTAASGWAGSQPPLGRCWQGPGSESLHCGLTCLTNTPGLGWAEGCRPECGRTSPYSEYAQVSRKLRGGASFQNLESAVYSRFGVLSPPPRILSRGSLHLSKVITNWVSCSKLLNQKFIYLDTNLFTHSNIYLFLHSFGFPPICLMAH